MSNNCHTPRHFYSSVFIVHGYIVFHAVWRSCLQLLSAYRFTFPQPAISQLLWLSERKKANLWSEPIRR